MLPALDKRIAEYQILYGDLRSVIWVIYSDLIIATHKEGADEAILTLLRDPNVLQGIIAAIRRRTEKLVTMPRRSVAAPRAWRRPRRAPFRAAVRREKGPDERGDPG